MKLSLALGFGAMLCATSAYAAGNTANIWTGSTAGTYYNVLGPALKAGVEDANKSMLRKQAVFVKESAGSGDNIDKVIASPDDYAFAQKDVVAIRTKGTDALLNDLGLQKVDERGLVTVRDDIASECLYMVVGKEFASQVDSFGQILTVADGLQVATAGAKSGSHATLSFIKSVVPEMKNIKIQNYNSAADAIKKVASGEEVVAFFVQMPDPKNDLFKLISEKDLGIIGVGHEAMFNLTVNELPVYEVQTNPVQDATWASFIGRGKSLKTVETACTPATIITSEKSNSKMVAKLKSYPAAQLRPQVDWFQNMVNSTSKQANPSALLENVRSGFNRGIERFNK